MPTRKRLNTVDQRSHRKPVFIDLTRPPETRRRPKRVNGRRVRAGEAAARTR